MQWMANGIERHFDNTDGDRRTSTVTPAAVSDVIRASVRSDSGVCVASEITGGTGRGRSVLSVSATAGVLVRGQGSTIKVETAGDKGSRGLLPPSFPTGGIAGRFRIDRG